MTHREMEVLGRLSDIAARVSTARSKRATALAIRAGLDASRHVWSNAMISRSQGRPWAEVDYSLLRQALRVDALPSASVAVDAYYRRVLGRKVA